MAHSDREVLAVVGRLYWFARRHWLLIALCVVVGSSYAALETYYLLLLKPFIQAFTDRSQMEANAVVDLPLLQSVGRQTLWLIVPVGVTCWLSHYLRGIAVWRIVIDVRDAICRALLPQPLAYFEEHRGGEFISRMSNDVALTQNALGFLFGDIFRLPVKLAASLAVAAYASWQLSLSVLVLGPLLILPLHLFGRKIRSASRKGLERMADITDALAQMFNGIRIVKAFKMEDAEAEEVHQINLRFLRNMRKAARNRAHGRGVVEIMVRAFFAVVLLATGPMVARGVWGLSAWRVALFVGGLWFAYDPMRKIIKCYNNLQEAAAGATRIFEILDLGPEQTDLPDAESLDEVRQGVRFDDVSFAYDDEPVLQHISFEVKKGETVALVGRSGAGKSTLMDLVLRFYAPQQGAISIDGRELRAIRRESLLDRVAVVAQQTFLFNRSVAENIRYGRRDATEEEVHDAARAANIHEFIASLPEGYDTAVGEFGVKLSGGQRQRIAIARALLKNADILILDEAMAGLDAESENLVRQALFRLMQARTTFVITHDLPTIQHADSIFVLAGGRLVQQGTHEALIEQPGEYSHLYHRQLAPVAGGGAPDASPEVAEDGG